MGTKFAMNFPNAMIKKWRVLSSNEQIMFMEKMTQTTYKKNLTMIIFKIKLKTKSKK
jgi:hypothetical protein